MINLPDDVLFSIFEYLTAKDLVQAGAVCKLFSKISKSGNLPNRLFIPKLPHRIIQENALTLWNYMDKTLYVDCEGRLIPLEFYHLRARIFVWYNGSNSALKVNKFVEMTLQEIYRLNDEGYIPKSCPEPCKPHNVIVQEKPKELSRLIYIWDLGWESIYSEFFPADYLADKILNNKRFSDLKIKKAAQLVKSQVQFYDKISKKYQPSVSVKDERVAWDEVSIEEARFSKNFKTSNN